MMLEEYRNKFLKHNSEVKSILCFQFLKRCFGIKLLYAIEILIFLTLKRLHRFTANSYKSTCTMLQFISELKFWNHLYFDNDTYLIKTVTFRKVSNFCVK